MIRKQQILVGQKVWVEQFRDLELPQGLRNGVRGTVTAYDSRAKSVTILDADGCAWTLDPIHLDTGWTFLVKGQSFAENTQKAKSYIKSLIADLRAQPDHPKFPELRQERIDALLAILSRNSRRKTAMV